MSNRCTPRACACSDLSRFEYRIRACRCVRTFEISIFHRRRLAWWGWDTFSMEGCLSVFCPIPASSYSSDGKQLWGWKTNLSSSPKVAQPSPAAGCDLTPPSIRSMSLHRNRRSQPVLSPPGECAWWQAKVSARLALVVLAAPEEAADLLTHGFLPILVLLRLKRQHEKLLLTRLAALVLVAGVLHFEDLGCDSSQLM